MVASEDSPWRPIVLYLTRKDDQAHLTALLESGQIHFRHDTLVEQLRELMAARQPQARGLSEKDLDAAVRRQLAGCDPVTYGAWVFYPWSGRLVHVLPRDELVELRTDRNRYKITPDEQRRLGVCRIGVLGLSVGNAAALTFALEGVGGTFRLADFDHLSLSNLNRLRASLHELGTKKTTLCARAMFEINPYLDIEVFPDGLREEDVEPFLSSRPGGEGKLDLLVEECDDLYMKVAVRERARALRIPVVMDTSDRGLLDVERFDLEPDRPILHGLLGDVPAERLKGLPTKEKVPIVLGILGGRRMSTRMAASLPEINESISTWPQLASAVALGGAITCDVARRILLGKMRASGRFYVDIEELAQDGAGELAEPVLSRPPRAIAPEALRVAELPPRPRDMGIADAETIRWIVAHGILAPSAHNAQPWRFVFRDGCLECRLDRRHDLSMLDFEQRATWVAFGAALENMDLAARSVGLCPDVRVFPEDGDPDLVCHVAFSPGPPETSDLLSHLRARVTNRKVGVRAPLDRTTAAALTDAAHLRGAALALVCESNALDELGALMGACDRITAMNRAIFHQVMPGYRWTREEVERYRDGLDVATLELSEADRSGLELLSDWSVMECLGRLGGGRALESSARRAVSGSCAIGRLTVPGTGRESFLAGGRAVERVWLTATARCVALQPWTGLPYLFARLEHGEAAGLSEAEARELEALRVRYVRALPVPPGHSEVLLFRLAHADPPTARALRRRLEEVLAIA